MWITSIGLEPRVGVSCDIQPSSHWGSSSRLDCSCVSVSFGALRPWPRDIVAFEFAHRVCSHI
jgi:hypothetical protein